MENLDPKSPHGILIKRIEELVKMTEMGFGGWDDCTVLGRDYLIGAIQGLLGVLPLFEIPESDRDLVVVSLMDLQNCKTVPDGLRPSFDTAIRGVNPNFMAEMLAG